MPRKEIIAFASGRGKGVAKENRFPAQPIVEAFVEFLKKDHGWTLRTFVGDGACTMSAFIETCRMLPPTLAAGDAFCLVWCGHFSERLLDESELGFGWPTPTFSCLDGEVDADDVRRALKTPPDGPYGCAIIDGCESAAALVRDDDLPSTLTIPQVLAAKHSTLVTLSAAGEDQEAAVGVFLPALADVCRALPDREQTWRAVRRAVHERMEKDGHANVPHLTGPEHLLERRAFILAR